MKELDSRRTAAQEARLYYELTQPSRPAARPSRYRHLTLTRSRLQSLALSLLRESSSPTLKTTAVMTVLAGASTRCSHTELPLPGLSQADTSRPYGAVSVRLHAAGGMFRLHSVVGIVRTTVTINSVNYVVW